ncbi:MAG TPA: type VI secretion system protein, partial [Edaphobacter sp.]|nr:type VI secretion system protein [Edaphobacter sp.]
MSTIAAAFFTVGTIPLLWACLVVLLVMLLLLIVFLVWQAKRVASPRSPEGDGSDKASDSAKAGDSNVAVAEMSGSFSGAMQTLRSRVPGKDFRYTVPWFLLLGLPGSGKSSLLSESSLSMSLDEQVAVDNGVGIAWNFFGDAVVIDVGGWSFGSDSASVSAWRRLLRLFVNNRPERPLDGIVLTIAATDFVGPEALSPTVLIERGTLLQQRLRQLTQIVGFHLPVYFVLTKCDAIRGFSEFAQELESSQLEQIFGWSNPYGDNQVFQPEWIDEAINSMRVTLERVQSSLFAIHEPTQDRPSMFLFPGSLYALAPSLRIFLSRVMRGSGDMPAPMFRGIYCCGSTQKGVRPAPKTMELVPVSQPTDRPSTDFGQYDREQSGLSWLPNLLEPWLRSSLQIAFAHDLFFRKIFPERGLAVPLSHFFAARDRLRLVLQIACCSVAVVLILGTAFAARRLGRERDRLLPLLSRIESDLQHPPRFDLNVSSANDHPGADDLINAMASFQSQGFHSVFLPASWFTNINHQVQLVIGHAFHVLVLQRFHQGLEQRSQQLADLSRSPLPEASLASSDPDAPPAMKLERLPEYLQMQEFIRRVAALDKNIVLYNTLSRRNSDVPLQTVINIDGYLHNRSQQIPIDEDANPYFQEAVRAAKWSPFVYDESIRNQMSAKAQQLTTTLYSAWIEHNPTRSSTEALVAAIGAISTPGVHSYQDLANLQRSFSRTQHTYDDPELQWTGADDMQISSALGAVTTKAATASPFFEPWLHDWMLDLADVDFRKLAAALDDAQTPLTGNVSTVVDGKLQLSQRSQDMQTAVENLLSLPFMSGTTGPVNLMQPRNGYVTWNKAALNTATTLPLSYERYLVEDLDQAPAPMRNTLSRIAASQLTHSLQLAIVEAEQPASGALNSIERAQTFNDVAPSIETLIASLQQYDLAAPLSQLRQVSTNQAAGILSDLDHDLNQSEPYGFSTAAFSQWNGDQPATVQLFDAPTPDALAAYLATQREEMEALNTAAVPLVRFLSMYRSSLSPASVRALRRWEDIGTALNQYHAKIPGNSVQVLENFVATGVDKVLPSNGCAREKFVGSIAKRPDYFTLAASQLRQGLSLRCNALLTEDFEASYSRLRLRFNRDLAQRFPFAPVSSSALNDAGPLEISEFYRQYDTTADLLGAAFKGSGVSGTSESANFLTSLRDTRPWFASLLTTASAGVAASLDVVPQFRADRKNEVGGNQIIEWTFQVGNVTVRGEDPPTKLHWNYGDPVSLTLRWAKDSPFVPAIPSSAAGPSPRVEGDSVSWTFKDGWSLIRFIQTFNAGPAFEQPFLLAFNIPEKPASVSSEKLQTQT